MTRQEWLVAFGARVRSARIGNDLRQRDVAERLGVSRPWVANVEAGTRDCSAVAVAQLVALLGVQLPRWEWPT